MRNGADANSECGTVLTQIRSSEFGMWNVENCSGRMEAIYTTQCRNLPAEALGRSLRVEALDKKSASSDADFMY